MMLRLGVGLAVALGAVCSWGQQPAIAEPIENSALQIWSAVKSAVGSKPARKRPASKKESPDSQEANVGPEPIPPLPVRKDGKATPATPPKVAAPLPDVWQPAEIAAAKARCTALLKTIDAKVIPQPPIKNGRCGSPAPIRLVSLGKKPQVKFSPPALVNCKMAVALDKWINGDLQRLARANLDTEITTVAVMSDYSCRSSSGRVKNRLSEHSFANALDIRGFVTAKGQTAHVLAVWGLTERDVAAHAAAAKAEAAMAASFAKGESGKIVQKASASVPGDKIVKGDTKTASLGGVGLGGPDTALDRKAARTAKIEALSLQLPATSAPTGKSKFLRAAHAAACRIFGTTLGPEANEAHRNHFHVDMATRKYKKICD